MANTNGGVLRRAATAPQEMVMEIVTETADGAAAGRRLSRLLKVKNLRRTPRSKRAVIRALQSFTAKPVRYGVVEMHMTEIQPGYLLKESEPGTGRWDEIGVVTGMEVHRS